MPVPRPLALVAELTYRCPLRCPYCSNPVDCGAPRYRRELGTEEWARVFREAGRLGVLQLGLSGGEPLLRPDLEALVAAAAEEGLYSTLVTSAVPLSPERLARLRAAGLDHIQISIQSARPEESDRIAGARVFHGKLAAARAAKALGLPLTLNVVLHRGNLDRIEEILALAEELGADRLELANTQYYGWALLNRAALLPTPDQLARAERAVAEARARLGPRLEILYVIPDYYEDYPKPCSGGWGQRLLVVSPAGDALPCHAASILPELAFPNVREHALEWIWFESEAFNRFRGTDWMPEPCRSCPRRTLDFGGCRCQAFALTGDAAATDPACRLAPAHGLVRAAREAAASATAPVPLTYRSLRGAPASR